MYENGIDVMGQDTSTVNDNKSKPSHLP